MELLATRRRGWRRWRAAACMLAVVPAMVAACSWGWGRAPRPAEERPHLVWPEPPDRPRIELAAVFAGASDLGMTRSVWARLASLIAGGAERRMVRPAGVAAVGERIAVADPGAAMVHLYDRSRRRAFALAACGDTALAAPVAVAVLGDRLYVSDALLARILVFDFTGACETSWGLDPGSRPAGLAADPRRARLYVADVGAHQVLGFDPQGRRVFRRGGRGGGPGQFNYPIWLSVDATGHLYVTDALNFRVQVFDPDGAPIGAFGAQGDGSGDLARPKGIGVDGAGHIYLVDALFDAVQIFDGDGNYLMAFGSRGRGPGNFWLPSGLAVDGDRIYVADSYNRRVQMFRVIEGAP